MTTPTITEFLLARIAEDESAADRVEFRPYVGDGVPQSLTDRVLAECEAKRRIVEVARYAPEGAGGWGFRRTLRALASVYADHPDYRDEWRP